MPAPPPKGASSRRRCGPWPKLRRSITSTSRSPRSIALATRLTRNGDSKNSGNIETMEIFTRHRVSWWRTERVGVRSGAWWYSASQKTISVRSAPAHHGVMIPTPAAIGCARRVLASIRLSPWPAAPPAQPSIRGARASNGPQPATRSSRCGTARRRRRNPNGARLVRTSSDRATRWGGVAPWPQRNPCIWSWTCARRPCRQVPVIQPATTVWERRGALTGGTRRKAGYLINSGPRCGGRSSPPRTSWPHGTSAPISGSSPPKWPSRPTEETSSSSERRWHGRGRWEPQGSWKKLSLAGLTPSLVSRWNTPRSEVAC